ncbi:AAA family ATPase [Cohnella luojiensis]|uniref:YhaN AAA domain-containing protein n=1 Tax=Cohnella luojiensis TaxID=652876 RepID=A0A4Y8MB08_9BACL|nr:AAA family ATPase [Cohnella luojiensis]TFE30793.1 hypothetical protein E2980_03155 [Cohnella luojiensis]
MYIRELQVDGYGALHGLKLELEAPITVIYGPNEAGKSTLLRFVRSMLYGFPTRKDPVERGEPVFGGRHGGRLLLKDRAGREWLLERYADRGNEMTLRDGGGLERMLAQPEWERLLLGGISERLFRQLFSVSLNELHELRSLQGEELGNYLYHAGLAGGSSLSGARRQIGAEMDRLFRPKGTTQEMNRLLAAIKETETAIRQGRDRLQHYRETEAALAQVEQQLASADKSLPELRLQAAKLQNGYDLREWWLKRETLLTEDSELRGQLADPSAALMPEGSFTRWSGLKTSRVEAASKLAEARRAVGELRSNLDQLNWDDAWVSTVPEWERLESMREAILAKREERAELEAERRSLDETVQSTLARLSAEWGETELLSFGGLAAEREQVRRLQQSWEEAERASVNLQAELRRLNRQQEVLRTEMDNVADQTMTKAPNAISSGSGQVSSLGSFIPKSKPALLQAWHNLEDARRDYDRARVNVAPPLALNSRSNTSKGHLPFMPLMTGGLAGLAGVIGLILPFLFGIEGNPSKYIYILSTCVLLLAVVLMIYASYNRSSRNPKESSTLSGAAGDDYITGLKLHHRQMNEKLRQLMNEPEAAVTKLLPNIPLATNSMGSLQQPDLEDTIWQQLREAVHEQLDRLEEIDRGNSKQQELHQRLQELQRERELVERDSIAQRERMEELTARWENWLLERKLPVHLAPESLPELLGMAEQGQAVLRQRQRLSDRSDTLLRAIREFEQAAGQLMKICPPPNGIGADAVQAVQWLYKEAVRQFAVKEKAEQLIRQLAKAKVDAEEASKELAAIEGRMASLFLEANVGSEAELEQRLRIDERCLELRKEAREIQLRLESGRDPEAQSQLYELLRTYDDATLSSLLTEQKLLLEAEEERRSELLDRRGRLTQDLDRQRGEAELEDKGQRLRELQSKLELLTERYAILAISDRLIVRTKAVYEEEKQPEVLQTASRYFRQMTNGAYSRIVAPGDSKALLAETNDRRLMDSLFLSRGTQEQLYLAMRFALCDAASPEQPLPLLLDDLFVHFDEQRLIQSLPVLEDLSEIRQLILFTCHRHIAQTLVAGIPAARMLELKG